MRTITVARLLLFSAACFCCVNARGEETAETVPDGLTIVAVKVVPSEVLLYHQFDYRQVLLLGELESGEQIDLTRIATLSTEPKHVTVSTTRQIRGQTVGQETLQFSVAGHQLELPVSVESVDAPDVSYVRDVSPAMSKMGCNAGTCHGAQGGQNGFKLSLRGYDFLFDHRALTDDIGSRRFNRAAPDQSLMLLKASGSIPHVGAMLTKPGEPYYEALRQWIADGCPLDLESPRVSKIELSPHDPVLPRAGLKQQIAVMATYSDGTVRDVTAEAFIESGNIELISVDKQGLLTLLRRGEGPVLARYEGAYAATTITIMGDRTGFQWQDSPTNNYIDDLVYAKLQRVKILPSGLCTDAEFIRRVFLDITGLPPSADAVRSFLSDGRPTKVKRDELIDRLIGNREYIEHWTNKWADLLQVNRRFLGEEGAAALRDWIKTSIATNKPYDQFAHEVLAAKGSTVDNPAAAYWKILRDPAVAMENTTHLFLAIRFNCNKCHDHPFEKWTQDQYYHLTAYFAQVARKRDPRFSGKKIGGSAVEQATPLVEVVYDSGSGETKHERTGQIVEPSFPYDHKSFASESYSRREQLAKWIASPDNKYFATSFVNRLWGYLLGTGLIEPIDDIRAGNPPTNPELLERLTHDFVQSGFDVQHMLRTICKSRAYQHSVRSNEWNVDDAINYSHAKPRRLPAEVLFDSIHHAVGSQTKIPGVPVGFRAAELPDVGVKVPFLDDFGRPPRQSVCECDRSGSVELGPIMKLINGPTVAQAVADPQGDLAKLANSDKSDREVIEEMFLRLLARMPSEAEYRLGIDAFAEAKMDYDMAVNALADYEQKMALKQADWEASLARETEWTVLEPSGTSSLAGAEFEKKDDHSVLVSGKLDLDTYAVQATTNLQSIAGLRIEALMDGSLPAQGPGRADNGNFVLSELTLERAPLSTDDSDDYAEVKLVNGKADFSQGGYDVSAAVDGKQDTGWAVSPQFGKSHEASFEVAEPIQNTGGSRLRVSLVQNYADKKHSLGRFRLSVTDSPRPFGKADVPKGILQLVSIPVTERTPEQAQKLTDYYLGKDAEWKRLRAQRDTIGANGSSRMLGMQDLAWALINNPSFLFNR